MSQIVYIFVAYLIYLRHNMEKLKIQIINGVEIFAVKDDKSQIFVPVKPICEAIGVAFQTQHLKLQEHPILGPTVTLGVIVAADGKEREMVCLPLEFIFGWLFTINPRNVAEASRESVIRFQSECYHALYVHFAGSLQETIEQNKEELSLLRRIASLKEEEKSIKSRRIEAENSLAKLRDSRLDKNPLLDLK